MAMSFTYQHRGRLQAQRVGQIWHLQFDTTYELDKFLMDNAGPKLYGMAMNRMYKVRAVLFKEKMLILETVIDPFKGCE